MKILIVSDLHYTLPQFDWVVAVAPSYDLVVIAGDLLDIASMVDPETQIIVVLKYLRRLRALTKIIVCSGNHDLDGIGANGENQAVWMNAVKRLAIPADGDTMFIDGTMITICPWWDGPLTQKAIGRQFADALQYRDGPWIWVYHAPPNTSPISWEGHRHYGDAALNGWIAEYAPDLVICGHVHDAPFVGHGSWVDRIGDTWAFNTGRQIGEVPTSIVIDTMAREAAWFSNEGAQSVGLDRALTRPIAELEAMPTWMSHRPAGE
jgi:Icc-related predicted phosphoesterase